MTLKFTMLLLFLLFGLAHKRYSYLSHIWDTITCDNPKSAYAISTFPPTGYLPVMVIIIGHVF